MGWFELFGLGFAFISMGFLFCSGLCGRGVGWFPFGLRLLLPSGIVLSVSQMSHWVVVLFANVQVGQVQGVLLCVFVSSKVLRVWYSGRGMFLFCFSVACRRRWVVVSSSGVGAGRMGALSEFILCVRVSERDRNTEVSVVQGVGFVGECQCCLSFGS